MYLTVIAPFPACDYIDMNITTPPVLLGFSVYSCHNFCFDRSKYISRKQKKMKKESRTFQIMMYQHKTWAAASENLIWVHLQSLSHHAFCGSRSFLKGQVLSLAEGPTPLLTQNWPWWWEARGPWLHTVVESDFWLPLEWHAPVGISD